MSTGRVSNLRVHLSYRKYIHPEAGRVPDLRVHLSYHKCIHPEVVVVDGLLKIQIRQQFRHETLQFGEFPQMH